MVVVIATGLLVAVAFWGLCLGEKRLLLLGKTGLGVVVVVVVVVLLVVALVVVVLRVVVLGVVLGVGMTSFERTPLLDLEPEAAHKPGYVDEQDVPLGHLEQAFPASYISPPM